MDVTCSYLGNVEIMKREKIAFLSSRKVPPAAVMQSLDWAEAMRDAGHCVIGGFQSALERDVLRVLLKEGSNRVIMVLARKLWQIVPKEYREAISDGRMLVVSPVSQSIRRVTEETALVRNRFILQNCDSAVFATIEPGGSLNYLLSEFTKLPYGVLADIRELQL